MTLILISAMVYMLLNVYVTKRINASFYVEPRIKCFHRKFIWVFPFLGPLLIRHFWKKQKHVPLKINTKEERDKNTTYDGFYESGLGL